MSSAYRAGSARAKKPRRIAARPATSPSACHVRASIQNPVSTSLANLRSPFSDVPGRYLPTHLPPPASRSAGRERDGRRRPGPSIVRKTVCIVERWVRQATARVRWACHIRGLKRVYACGRRGTKLCSGWYRYTQNILNMTLPRQTSLSMMFSLGFCECQS